MTIFPSSTDHNLRANGAIGNNACAALLPDVVVVWEKPARYSIAARRLYNYCVASASHRLMINTQAYQNKGFFVILSECGAKIASITKSVASYVLRDNRGRSRQWQKELPFFQLLPQWQLSQLSAVTIGATRSQHPMQRFYNRPNGANLTDYSGRAFGPVRPSRYGGR